jgi:hypothetical protein
MASNTSVYWLVIAIALILLGYITFILPESFDKPKRVLLQERWAKERAERAPTGWLKSTLGTLFRPLALLKPHRNPTTGVRNLRLLWCGMHAFFSGIASGYIWSAVIIYLALHLGYKPDDVSPISILLKILSSSFHRLAEWIYADYRGCCNRRFVDCHHSSCDQIWSPFVPRSG